MNMNEESENLNKEISKYSKMKIFNGILKVDEKD